MTRRKKVSLCQICGERCKGKRRKFCTDECKKAHLKAYHAAYWAAYIETHGQPRKGIDSREEHKRYRLKQALKRGLA